LIQTIKVVVALFIITDSIGNLPLFMGLTEGMSNEERRKVIRTALWTGLILIAVFGLAGSLIFELFNITIEDVKIAGGILLFIIAIEILMKGQVGNEHQKDIGIVPLGCPLLVGPGAITTIFMMMKIYNVFIVITGVLICFFLIWLVFYFAENIYGFLGKNGSLLVAKIAAIIIAAIAVRFIRQAVQVIFHLI